MSPARPDVVVVGAGLVGSLLSTRLVRRGYRVRLYERGPDPPVGAAAGGRSVHLVVSKRGGKHFADARPLIPALEAEYVARPVSDLVTIRCFPWRHRDRVALVGDAAHATGPFFGQGMNAGFEDCVVLDECLAAMGGDWGAAFAADEARRKPDCDAVTELSLRNVVELSERVGDPRFLLQRRLEQKIHRLAPAAFVTLYQMVAFSDVPYARAKAVAEAQDALVARIMAAPGIESTWDSPEVEALIREQLARLPRGGLPTNGGEA